MWRAVKPETSRSIFVCPKPEEVWRRLCPVDCSLWLLYKVAVYPPWKCQRKPKTIGDGRVAIEMKHSFLRKYASCRACMTMAFDKEWMSGVLTGELVDMVVLWLTWASSCGALPTTNKSPLKMDGTGRLVSFLFGARPIFRGDLLVSGMASHSIHAKMVYLFTVVYLHKWLILTVDFLSLLVGRCSFFREGRQYIVKLQDVSSNPPIGLPSKSVVAGIAWWTTEQVSCLTVATVYHHGNPSLTRPSIKFLRAETHHFLVCIRSFLLNIGGSPKMVWYSIPDQPFQLPFWLQGRTLCMFRFSLFLKTQWDLPCHVFLFMFGCFCNLLLHGDL